MRTEDRVRVHRRDRVQAPQDQLPRAVVPTDPHLIGTGVRDGARIDQEDSSRVLVPGVLVALDLLNLCGGTCRSVEFVTAIIWVSVSRAPPVVLSVGRQVTMRGNARIEPHRVNPLVEITTGIRLLPLEPILVKLQDKPNRAATSVVGPPVRLEFTP